MAAPVHPFFDQRPYWMNPDGTVRALCAAPAGDDDGHYNWHEWHAAPMPAVPPAPPAVPAPLAGGQRVVLNPEDDEDEGEAPPSPVYAPDDEEAPVPPIVEPVVPPPSPWTEWATVPDAHGPFTRTTPYCVREWRFKFPNPDALQHRLVIQVRLFGGDTETHIVPLEQLKLVKGKHDDYNYAVHLDLSKYTPRGVWTPKFIKLSFTKEENALAFQEALVDYLATA
jgi:hypothetical protein